MKKENPYSLPNHIIPLIYNIELTPNFKELTFKGEEKIKINVLKDTKEISLNIKGLEINSVSLQNNSIKKMKEDKEKQIIIFYFEKIIKKGEYNLIVNFGGKVAENLRGFYKSMYIVGEEKRTMLTTQFEPNDARKCFPSFDQPDMKAKFNISLTIPDNLNAVSNMPIKSESLFSNLKKVTFEETPIMSTYLVAFVIGELEYLESKTKDNVLVRVITTPGKKHKAKFALDFAIKALEYYNDYFKIPYPLPKLDLIEIPDFESGAMENWGLITYRETQILFDENESSVGIKQAVATTISHELAHQWFGNLVTMKWWNDLWLNEGFASWIEYKATNKIHPEFEMWTQYIGDEKIGALYLDSLNNTHPIEVDVTNPEEINEIFDAISYNKGSCIIRMLEEYLGEEIFREGLKHYMNKFKYDNADTDDLWNSMEEISKKPVKKLMHSWTKQEGYPIISATYKDNKLILEQERFSYIKNKDNKLWTIPVSILDNNKIKYYEMSKKKLEININKDIIINHNQVGFYRIKYDEEFFKEVINYKLNIIDKIGLENDVFALARGSHVPVKNFLKLALKLKKETDQEIWNDLSSSLGKISQLFSDKYEKEMDEYIKNLYSEIYKKVGWEEKTKESHTEKLLRSNVIATLGFSNHKEVLDKAKKMFNEYLKGKKINPNLRTLIYNLTAFTGDRKIYEKLKELYLKEKSSEEKIRFLGSLGIFKDKTILQDALKFSLSKEVKSQDAMYVLATVGSNEHADDLAWKFLRENWKVYYEKYGEGHVLPSLIKSVLSKFSSLDRIKEIQDFFSKHKLKGAQRSIQQSIEMIRINHNFVNYNEKDLKEFFKKDF